MSSDAIAIGLFLIGIIFFLIAYFMDSSSDTSTISLPQSNLSTQQYNTQNSSLLHREQNIDFKEFIPPLQSESPPLNHFNIQQYSTSNVSPIYKEQSRNLSEMKDANQGTNPSFFQLHSYLYLDYNTTNVYTGESINFKLNDITSIRRFGEGIFTYDGLKFTFDHKSGCYNFPIKSIKHISFYLNCLVISQKNKEPAALFFLENTKYVKDILEAFQKKGVNDNEL